MATQAPVAPATRQPFAPLNQQRLQSLTSLKNRQNAISTSPSKRKAEFHDYDHDDSENIDPVFNASPKRTKSADGTDALFKPSKFILTNAPPSPNDQPSSVFKPTITKTRPILKPRSPLKISSPKAPLSAPAGRSPTRKRVGILNRRRTGGSPNAFTRVDPPAFSLGGASGKTSLGSGLPFTIDAALKGTLPSYARRNTPKPEKAAPAPTLSAQSASSAQAQPDMISIPQLYQPTPKSSWFFDIHEDTLEEENTNLMYHSTCTLDISSDEETLTRSRSRACNKENVPPMNDQSQTSYRHQESAGLVSKRKPRGRKEKDPDACDVDRVALGEMPAEDFFAEGCDKNSAWVVLEDVYEEVQEEAQAPSCAPTEEKQAAGKASSKFDFSTVPQITLNEEEQPTGKSVEELMSKEEGPPARVLEPMEKPEEGWKIWESGSANGDE